MSGAAASPEDCYMIYTERERWKRMSSQKDVDQGSNKDDEAKPISRSLPAGRTRQHEENLHGAYPVDGGCRGSIGTSVKILVYTETIAVTNQA